MSQSSPQILQLAQFKSVLAPRRQDWHKGNSGHVLVVGGDEGHSGAVRMAAEAALRVGAGLVTVATHPSHAAFLNIDRPELMVRALTTSLHLKPLLAKADVVVLGPGLGLSPWAKRIFKLVVQSGLLLIIDADGLNLLAHTSRHNPRWILTPHPGEAGRLLHIPTTQVQADRIGAAQRIQAKYAGITVLKGSNTLIKSESTLTQCKAGNPGMATGGMGDVLAGVIGGLCAQQGIEPLTATELGVLLHATAADHAAKAAGERGLLAMDLMPYLRVLANP